ncbi:MAG: hypothetical protein CMB56_002365 [Methanobacteriota archaeon]|nr:MAG: hypothetical protein CMB56_002365 [Euryarchaeota archaeon]|tara:strand:- start:283 stop:615 length:333 start_codon:yes stop_codon:yes gene_type:complete
MTSRLELERRLINERARIEMVMSKAKGKKLQSIKGGKTMVAFVSDDACIGCDQCPTVCDDNAIEMFYSPIKSPLIEVHSNRKAKILREDCTGCRLCVLSCPTDAIKMIER